jgi:hypothetical protein
MGETRAVHVRDGFDLYIGRRTRRYPESLWANPFRIGRHGDRETVIELYRQRLLKRPDLLARLPELRGLRLGCWCKPEHACHGDILAALADGSDHAP